MPVCFSNGASRLEITLLSSVPKGAFANWSVTPAYGWAVSPTLMRRAADTFSAMAPAVGTASAKPAALLRNSRRLWLDGSATPSSASASRLLSNLSTVKPPSPLADRPLGATVSASGARRRVYAVICRDCKFGPHPAIGYNSPLVGAIRDVSEHTL